MQDVFGEGKNMAVQMYVISPAILAIQSLPVKRTKHDWINTVYSIKLIDCEYGQ